MDVDKNSILGKRDMPRIDAKLPTLLGVFC